MSKKSKIVKAIEKLTKRDGVHPAVEDIAKAVWMTTASVYSYLWELKVDGRVAFDTKGKPRVRLLPPKPVLEYRGIVK